MADNVDITEGSGKTVASDDIQVDGSHSQGQVQFVKLIDGTLNGTGSIRVNQAAKANALTVAPASDISDATYIGDIKFGEALPAGTNEIGKLAAGTAGIGKLTANSGIDIGDVDVTSIVPLTGATNLGKARDVAIGANDVGVMALVVRDDSLTTLTPADGDFVPLRVGSTGALHVTGGGGGTEYTEDVTTANPQVGSAIMIERDDALTTVTPVEGDWIGLRGTAEGALWTQDFNSDAMAASLSILDDWDDSNFCNVNLNLAGTDAGVGESALDGTELRVTIATDDDSVAHLATIAGAVSATHMQCDIVAGTVTTVSTVTNLAQMGGTAITMDEGVHGTGVQRVTIATDDDGVLSLGIIDDWDAVHDSAASSDGPQVMAAYDSTKPAVVEDGDAVRMLADQYGRLLVGVEPQHFQTVFDSADASGEGNAVHASAASTIIVVQSYIISSDAELWVKLQEEDSTALTGKFWLKAGGGVAITLPKNAPIVLGVDSDLEVITEGAGDVSVSVTGYTIPG